MTLGRTTTDADIDRAVEIIPQTIAQMRSAAALVAADPLGEQVSA